MAVFIEFVRYPAFRGALAVVLDGSGGGSRLGCSALKGGRCYVLTTL